MEVFELKLQRLKPMVERDSVAELKLGPPKSQTFSNFHAKDAQLLTD
jgi:hypothetical protein